MNSGWIATADALPEPGQEVVGFYLHGDWRGPYLVECLEGSRVPTETGWWGCEASREFPAPDFWCPPPGEEPL